MKDNKNMEKVLESVTNLDDVMNMESTPGLDKMFAYGALYAMEQMALMGHEADELEDLRKMPFDCPEWLAEAYEETLTWTPKIPRKIKSCLRHVKDMIYHELTAPQEVLSQMKDE